VYGFKSHLSQPDRESKRKESKVSVSKEITHLEKSNVRLTLTIPKDEVASGYRDILNDYAKNVQIPGFRKGKVPTSVLERKFGEALKEEALGKILEKSIEDVFDALPDDEKPLSYSQPSMDDRPKMDLENDLVFSLTYDVLPKVDVGRWKGLETEVPEAVVGDEDIARELEVVRERNSFVLDRDDAARARLGDIVTIDFCHLEGGEVAPDTARNDFAYTLGSGQSMYMFDDDIVGMAKGETKEFAKTYPETPAEGAPAGIQALAGRTIDIRVTLTALKEKKLPELDDELAQDVDEKFRTLDDLKKDIRERLESTLEARTREMKINGILDKIMETTPITLPESMVRAEIGGRFRALARNFGMDTETVMRMLAAGGEGLENLEGKWRPGAEKALRSRLIVETLMDEQKIEVGEDDLKQELGKISPETDMSMEEVAARYTDEQLEMFRESIRERRFFDLLLSENTVKTGSRVGYLDLMANSE